LCECAARVGAETRDELRGRKRRRVGGGESRARDEGEGEPALVRFEPLLPTRLTDDDAVLDGLRVGQELVAPHGRDAARRVAVGRLVEAVDEEARVLELNREEEGRRRVDALDLAALRVRAARFDVRSPELRARR